MEHPDCGKNCGKPWANTEKWPDNADNDGENSRNPPPNS
jgi:hypothetical protein